MNEKIEKVRSILKEAAEEFDWKCHLSLVVKYAVKLGKLRNADLEVVELGALLHDIGRVKFGPKDHEITGTEEAERILRDLNYSEDVIEKVKHCVSTHRASVDRKAETLEAEIVRDADALSHFDALPLLARAGLRKFDGDVQKTTEWIYAKLQRDWNNKMHLPESKEMVKEKYKAAKLLLEAALGLNQ